MFRLAITIPLGVLLISFFINIILAVLLTFTYTSLTKEQLVATLQFTKTERERVYTAVLSSNTGDKIGNYLIYGDQWRIDANFIKLHYWANIFGLNSKYQLDRLEGRYKNVLDENSNQKISYQIDENRVLTVIDWFADITYGSSVYNDIKEGITFEVYKSQTGLLIRDNSKQKNSNSKESYFDKIKKFIVNTVK